MDNKLIFIKNLNKKNKWGARMAEYKCFCGSMAKLCLSHVNNNKIKSCGCLQWIKKHDMSNAPLYNVWQQMKHRCLNQNHSEYGQYGGRGINVCAKWANSFEDFYKDMGEKPTLNHSIDRVDNDKGYCKGNCRWATKKQQIINRRNMTKFYHYGLSLVACEWANVMEVPAGRINFRLRHGWNSFDAIFKLKQQGVSNR